MMIALSLLGSQNHSFIVPNRFEYGYGLTPEIVDMAAQQGAQMLVTVDNGISCVAGVSRAKELGLQVIVTDHHLPGRLQFHWHQKQFPDYLRVAHYYLTYRHL